MHGRARAFLSIVVLRNFGTGLLCVTASRRFAGPATDIIRGMIPLVSWAVLMFAVCLIAIAAVAADRDQLARLAVVVSAGITGAWAAGFTWSLWEHRLQFPPIPVAWWALMFKDWIIASMQMRSYVGVRNGILVRT